MKRENLYTLQTPYRQDFSIQGFRFGSGERSCAIVGGVRGNEVQQMYVCARLVQTLAQLEKQGAIPPGRELLVVPCVNHFSMNVGSRFWAMDKTDINRMFPGYDQGETTQRIAAALFQAVQGYRYGIHFASFYLPGDFVPHVRIMDTGYQTASLGNLFGLLVPSFCLLAKLCQQAERISFHLQQRLRLSSRLFANPYTCSFQVPDGTQMQYQHLS